MLLYSGLSSHSHYITKYFMGNAETKLRYTKLYWTQKESDYLKLKSEDTAFELPYNLLPNRRILELAVKKKDSRLQV